MTPSRFRQSRAIGAAITAAILALVATTTYIHFSLGGLLFLLNAAGYAGLMGLLAIGAVAPHPIVRRFSWFPRIALAGYTATTIAGYLVLGPYFWLGWVTKAVEVGILVLLALDIVRVYGTPAAMARQAVRSVFRRATAEPAAA